MIMVFPLFLLFFHMVNTAAESDCTWDRISESVTFSGGSKAFVNISWHEANAPFQRYTLQYCEIDKSEVKNFDGTKQPACIFQYNSRNFSRGMVLLNLDHNRTYAMRIACGIENRTQNRVVWEHTQYKIMDLGSNRSKILKSEAVFLEPDKTWKTSERSSVVILVIGASAITIGVPFAMYIACRRKKKERRRTISLVTGAMR